MEQLRAQLTGHTALVLLSLTGYFLYSTTYSIIFQIKNPSSRKSAPVPILEMWMTLTHLCSSILTCAVHAVILMPLTSPSQMMAEAQSALFLGVALTVTVSSLACMQVASKKSIACKAQG